MTTTSTLCPVWDGYCADPFVLVHEAGYTMYGTAPDGLLSNGRAFQTLHSDDLVHWRDLGGALEPLPGAADGTEYWAPEVMTAHGRFWMYYSAGVGDEGHHLRVAVSDFPEGPFLDTGTNLTPDLDFAIDPSPFVDQNGLRWLYFATDHLHGERPGTVLAVAPMHTPTHLGKRRIILTAFTDWQRYQANRLMYGERRDWHTLEGPTVVHRDGSYWMTYSGGNWHNAGYGVGLAAAPAPQGPWVAMGDGASLLSTESLGLVGPGHNSLFTGHDGRTYAVFHAWDDAGVRRRPYVCPVAWTDATPPLRLQLG
jgi:arabinan endo-1,5-alpha-L-arabinosidase